MLYPDLTFCDSFGGKGSSHGRFNEPCDIAVIPLSETATLQETCIHVVANYINSLDEISQLPLPKSLKRNITQYKMSDNVYVVDRYNHRVQVFSSSGQFLRCFGSDILTEPISITVDSNGFVYVCEKEKHYISLFTTSGKHIQNIGGGGAAPLQFNKPLAIVLDAAYVYNGGNNVVSVHITASA